MEGVLTDDTNTMSTDSPAHPTIIPRQTATVQCECKVCGGPARYSYYGAIVCHSCKMFFRRNAETGKATLKCDFGDGCKININNRRICSCCRLVKCCANGMRGEMIRSPWTERIKTNRKRKLITDSIPSTAIVRLCETVQIPTSNLLKSDQSTFSIDQWNRLSNLVDCFDKHNGFSYVDRFIHEQNSLPLKLRFKYSSINVFLTSMMSKVQQIFEKNRDFLSLSLHDRSILLRSTVEFTASFGGIFILRESQLFDSSTFCQSAELIFQPGGVALIRRVIDYLDSDVTFIKIIFAILSFSSINYTVYTKTSPTNLINIKAILPLQDEYIELAWRYLLHKYDHYQAVKCFSNLLRCLFMINDAIVEAHEGKRFREIIDFVIEQTEQTFYQ